MPIEKGLAMGELGTNKTGKATKKLDMTGALTVLKDVHILQKKVMGSLFMIKPLCGFLLGISLLAGCAPSHILHYREDVSRDFTTITFSGNSASYYHRSQVGGEHMSFVQVLGFKGDVFRVELVPEVGNVDFSIYGEGIVVEADPAGDNKQTVSAVDGEVLFSVGVSAYPYGEYILKISRL